MSTASTAPPDDDVVDGVYYPSSDGKPMAETQTHVYELARAIVVLRHYFRQQPDVLVIGNVFWYFEKNNPKRCRAPDLMVVKGVDTSRRLRSFRSWEHQATPGF